MRNPDPVGPSSPPRRLRARAVVVALAAGVVAALGAAERAEAGDYVVTQCSSVTPFVQASWERSSDHYRSRALCGTDDGLQVFHDAETTDLGKYGAWVWRAPAGTVFTDVQANASLTSQAGHHAELAVVRPGGTPVAFGAEHNDFRVHSIHGEFTQFQAWLRCVAPGPGKPCGRAGGDSAHAYIRGVYLRTDDRAGPRLAVTGGSLLGPQVVRGTRGLAFSATDVGSGIRKVYVEANGQTVVTDVRNCLVAKGFATALSPCPAATTESAAVPTTASAFVTGPDNVVSACVEDLALDGPPNRVCELRRVWVDNACPASPVGGGRTVEAAFGGEDQSTEVASDRPAFVRGRVPGAGAGATVCALTRVLIDGQPIVVGATGATAGDGSFAIELPPGPSREVYVHYVVGDQVLARHGLVLRSVATPSLHVSPNHGVRNHDRLHFSGELPGPACFDRVVKVQARIGKRRWQVFRTDRADEACRFAARYKLRSTAHAKRYRFRALVPQAAGYPYERGHSRTVKVKLRRRRHAHHHHV